MTITGGSGNDVLTASSGATAKADVLNGGAGNDTLIAGTNGAKVTGGAGNVLFVVTAAMEQIKAENDGNAVVAGADAAVGQAIWFVFHGDSYVVVDSGVSTVGSCANGEDLVVKLTGVDLTNASWNATHGTIALVLSPLRRHPPKHRGSARPKTPGTPCRGFFHVRPMGALLRMEIPLQVDHSERSEAQLHEGSEQDRPGRRPRSAV